MSTASRIAPGILWSKIQQQTRHALACGALQPIDTHYEFIEEGGMRFLVRVLANLARKEISDQHQAAQRQAGKDINPFLPYDENLFVANLSDTHLCLLNKFNVVDHHILIVTRAFEDQDTWLTLADFAALALCMGEIDGLAFYNAGRLAGASQRHKHLQLVPAPLCPDGSPLPLAQVIDRLGDGLPRANYTENQPSPQPFQNPVFSFRHGILGWPGDRPLTAEGLMDTYRTLLKSLGADLASDSPAFPYNLLVTRQWMMVVCRRQEHYQSIPVNSLGFAGSLLVKNADQLALLKHLGPMTILKNVACCSQVS
ncbi:MAG TPA: phosphorylase [Leptolyngbyaceae cyanobacterium M65_K2018_010]|nr:phosphorylase [Leptolyngbyaceae cyanobacterium M65_K2018_010]